MRQPRGGHVVLPGRIRNSLEGVEAELVPELAVVPLDASAAVGEGDEPAQPVDVVRLHHQLLSE